MLMPANEFVTRLRTSLTRFHEEAATFMQSQENEPVAGSVAATERATYPRADSPLTVAAIASILIELVGEHVTAFVKMITEPVEPIACWTCVRSMLESSSIAAWLFEPGIDAQTRVGRSFAIRYEGLVQEVKFAKSANRPKAEVQKLEDHINDVENVAATLGFPRLKNKKNERSGIGQFMPSATDMIRQMLDEERTYRLLSAVAHGHFWAINKLSFTQGTESVSGGVSTTQIIKHSGTVEGYTYLSLCVARAFGLPLWSQCLYFGWDKVKLTALLETVYDEFLVANVIRFWRPKAETK